MDYTAAAGTIKITEQSTRIHNVYNLWIELHS